MMVCGKVVGEGVLRVRDADQAGIPEERRIILRMRTIMW